MTVEEFIDIYMRESGLTPYERVGDLVIWTAHDGFQWKRHALLCECDEKYCPGWAMVHPEEYNYHKWEVGLNDITLDEAMAADLKITLEALKDT